MGSLARAPALVGAEAGQASPLSQPSAGIPPVVWSQPSFSDVGGIDTTVSLSTLALCPEDSLADPFLQAIDAVTGSSVSGGTLKLHGPAGDLPFTV
jgi:hypothetical protein